MAFILQQYLRISCTEWQVGRSSDLTHKTGIHAEPN
jgi:hypothetical protein